MKNLLCLLLAFCPTLLLAGQHSGLGGGTATPAPPPAPQNPAPETAVESLQRWIAEQIDAALSEQEQRRSSEN